jgi:hypothetical protein
MDVILNLLKFDLGILHDFRDSYFIKLIQSSMEEIVRRGIILDINKADDQILICDYAAWMYRKRQEDIPLSANIQHRLRNRIIKLRSTRL